MSETYENVIFHRYEVRPVDDELIFLLKKVRNLHVISVLKPVLDAEGYKIENIRLRWVRFSKDNPAAQEFRSPRTDNLHAVFALCISKNETHSVAIYQPFSHKVYMMDVKQVEPAEDFSIGERVQFVMDYILIACPFHDYTQVRRRSRCFKLKKCWFSNEVQLCATEDRYLTKEVARRDKPAEEAFYAENSKATIQRHRAMYFRK